MKTLLSPLLSTLAGMLQTRTVNLAALKQSRDSRRTHQAFKWRASPPRPPQESDPVEDEEDVKMAVENVSWGEERIANELLLKLGLRVSPRTVRKYMPRRRYRLARTTFEDCYKSGSLITTADALICHSVLGCPVRHKAYRYHYEAFRTQSRVTSMSSRARS